MTEEFDGDVEEFTASARILATIALQLASGDPERAVARVRQTFKPKLKIRADGEMSLTEFQIIRDAIWDMAGE
jgi:hypothetical protein